jgi:hypothetical protein
MRRTCYERKEFWSTTHIWQTLAVHEFHRLFAVVRLITNFKLRGTLLRIRDLDHLNLNEARLRGITIAGQDLL